MNHKTATPKAANKASKTRAVPPVSLDNTPKRRGRPPKDAAPAAPPAKAAPLKLAAGPAAKPGTASLTTGTAVLRLDIESIMPSPFQHRSGKMCDDAELPGLADSIKAHGILQPLTVRPAAPDAPSGIKHELVFGHRRLAAAKLAGLKTVPCILSAMDDSHAQFANVIENLQRKDLSPIDEADGVNELTQMEGMTAPQIAKALGVSERWVFRRRKLSSIIPEWRKIIRDEKAGQLFCERLAACPAPLQKVLLKTPLTKDPDADKIGGTLYEAGARDIKEMPWSKKHADWCFACPSIVDTVKGSDAEDLGQAYRLNGCKFCGDPACRAKKEKDWIKECQEAFARGTHKGTNAPPKLIRYEHEAECSWQKSPVPTTKNCVPFMLSEGQEAGKVFWCPKPQETKSREANKPKPEIPGKKEELARIIAIHALVETGARDVVSVRRALELVLLYGADFIDDDKAKDSSRHSQFLKALNMPDQALAEAVSKYVREDLFSVWQLDRHHYVTTEKDSHDYKGEAEQLALTFGISEGDITKKMRERADGND